MAEKEVYPHYCTQEETIKRMNYLLIGNGEPEDGMLFKFSTFMREHKIIVDDIAEIKDGVQGLHKRSDENKLAAATVASALEKYQAETKQFEAGKEALRVKRALAISRIIQIVTICISLFAAWMGYRKLNEGQKEIKTETQVTNEILSPGTRGTYYDPFKKDTVK